MSGTFLKNCLMIKSFVNLRQSGSICSALYTTNRSYVKNYSSVKFSDEENRWKQRSHRVHRGIAPYLLDRTRPASEILSNLEPEDAKRLDRLRKEHQILLSFKTKAMPETIDDRGWLDLLCEPSTRSRDRIYKLIFKRWSKAQRKIANHIPDQEELTDVEDQKLTFQRRPRCIRRIPRREMKMHCNNRLFHLFNLSQNLVVDMSYEEEMRLHDITSLCVQIREMIHVNRILSDPFHITFSNLKSDSNQYHMLGNALRVNIDGSKYQTIDDLPYTRTERCILSNSTEEERRQFLYLTPHSHNVLRQWEPDRTYIIGGLNDKVSCDPLSLIKARRLGIGHARLPLDEYVDWRRGRKSLTLDVMMKILARLKETDGDFRKALYESLPKRNIEIYDPLQRLKIDGITSPK